MRQTAYELVAILYREAISKHGTNWKNVEADVKSRLEQMEPALKTALMGELSFIIALGQRQENENLH